LIDGNTITIFDRTSEEFRDEFGLSQQCVGMFAPSPDGQRMFCATTKGWRILDLTTKKMEALPAGVDVIDWVSSESLLYPRMEADSSVRGTWLKRVGKPEQRITSEPCLAQRNVGPVFLSMKSAEQVVFVTRHGICRIKPDGSGFAEIAKLKRPPTRLKGITEGILK
jgi:hypothetical protein